MATWWVPDEFAFIDDVPKTSVGKFDKNILRQLLAEDRLPSRRLIEGDPIPEPDLSSREHSEHSHPKVRSQCPCTTPTAIEHRAREEGDLSGKSAG